MIPSKEEIERIACINQKNEDGSVNRDWARARLGCFTSSEISDLMSQSSEEKVYRKLIDEGTVKVTKTAMAAAKKENPNLSDDEIIHREYIRQLEEAREAFLLNRLNQGNITYILKVASERNMRKLFVEDDTLFDYYLQRVELFNRDMKWGNEMESYARGDYMRESGNEVAEVGFVRSDYVDWIGDSPDGLIIDKESGKPIGALEIKCPKSETFMRFKYEFSSKSDVEPYIVLKDFKPKYFWQCQMHCLCNHVDWCDFVVYDQMQNDGIIIKRIPAIKECMDEILSKVDCANGFIEQNKLVK